MALRWYALSSVTVCTLCAVGIDMAAYHISKCSLFLLHFSLIFFFRGVKRNQIEKWTNIVEHMSSPPPPLPPPLLPFEHAKCTTKSFISNAYLDGGVVVVVFSYSFWPRALFLFSNGIHHTSTTVSLDMLGLCLISSVFLYSITFLCVLQSYPWNSSEWNIYLKFSILLGSVFIYAFRLHLKIHVIR